MTHTIRMEQHDAKSCTMWADPVPLGHTASVQLAELRLQDPRQTLDHAWWWYPTSRVFSLWLHDTRETASLKFAESTGEAFLLYLEELQELLGRKDP